MIRVLIADDNAVIRQGVRALLTSATDDIEVVGEAATGREAIDQAELLHPDVVLLDIRMPVMDGVKAAERLSGQCKVMMLTYSDDEPMVAGAIRAGAHGYLVHGRFEPDELTRAVRDPRGSRVGSRRIGRRRVTVPDFYGCVASGGVFVHRLRIDGRRGARIVSVRFFFDAGQPARTDHRAPFRISFRLGFAPGSRHVAAAIVRYRLPGERRVRSVRLGRTFVMC